MMIPVKIPSVMPAYVQKEIDKGFVFVNERLKEFEGIRYATPSRELIEKLTFSIYNLDHFLDQIMIHCACCHIPCVWRKDYFVGQDLQDNMEATLKEWKILVPSGNGM